MQAAQKLKDRSYQERVLRRELNERRARRKLCNQVGLCQTTGCNRKKSFKSEGTQNSLSCDELRFESFCEPEDVQSEFSNRDSVDVEEVYSQDDSLADRRTEGFMSLSESKDDPSEVESIKSVVENYKDCENLADEIKEELELVKRNIAENINIQLGTMEETLQSLENYSDVCDIGDVWKRNISNSSQASNKPVVRNTRVECENNLFTVWSRLVSFAYQIVKLNHGKILITLL